MKTIKGIVIFLIIALVVSTIYLKPWKEYSIISNSTLDSLSKVDTTTHYKLYTPDGYILVKKEFVDSIMSIKNKVITITNSVPVPYIDNSKIYYHDSLVTNDINLQLYDTVNTNGIILSRTWSYRLFVPRLIEKEVEIIRPIPVPITKEKGLKYYGEIGIGVFSVGGGVIVRDRLMIGGEYNHFKTNTETKNVVSIKLGYIF